VTSLIDQTREFSGRGEEVHVPLDLESVFGWFTWLVLGLLCLLPGLPLLLAAVLRGSLAIAVPGGIATGLGLLAIRKMLRSLIRGLTIFTEGISVRRGLSTKEILWKDAEFYRFAMRDLEEPSHAEFQICSGTTRISFDVRPIWYRDILDRMEPSCPQAFSVDCITGQVCPPRVNDLGNFMGDEFKRVAIRESARFRRIAIAQILGLPLFAVLMIAVLIGPVFVIGLRVFPYGIADITANFRRASAAWQSYLRYAGE